MQPELRYELVEPAFEDDPVIGQRQQPGIGAIAFDRFLAEPDPARSDLVDGLGIGEVGVTVCAGPPKSLKTMLFGQLAICLASTDGTIPFLGRSLGAGGRVLFVEEEGNRHRLRERFRRQADGLGAESPAIDMLLFAGVRLDQPVWTKRLADAIRTEGYAMVVLDPFSFLHGADENKPAAMAPIMRALNRMAQEGPTSIVAIHHVTKPQADRPAGRLGDRIRGASSISAGVDCLLVLDREGDRRARLQGESRDSEPVDLHLELDVDSLLLSPVDAPAKAGGIVDTNTLLAFVTESGQVTAKEIMVRFGIRSKATALAYLEALPGIDRYEGPRGARFFRVKP